MEENTMRVNEIEEIEPDVEDEEVSEGSGSGAFVAGIIGGFLAYAVIGGAKKLAAFAQTKLAERKRKNETDPAIDTGVTEVSGDQTSSEENASEEK